MWRDRVMRVGMVLGFCLVALWSGAASAQNFDARLFHPVTNPHGLIGVHTSRALRHLSLYGQFSLDYANDEVLGQRGGAVVTRPIAHRLAGELGLAFGVLGWLEFGVSLPVYFLQISEQFKADAGQGTLIQGTDSRTSLGDIRVMAKARILENERFGGFGLGVVLELSLPTGSRDALAGDASLIFSPRLVVDYRHRSGIVFALNFAYRLRSEQTFRGLTIDDELHIALGAEVPIFFSRVSVIGEGLFVIGLPKFTGDGGFRGQANVSSELRTGLRWRHESGVVLTAGAGLGITGGFGAPDFRFFIDIRFGRNVATGKAVEPWFPDYGTAQPYKLVHRRGDPRTRPPVRRVVVRTPPKAQPPKKQTTIVLAAKAFDKAAASDPDPDGDGIPNSRDKCPNKPEDFDGFQDDDGCPDLDNDKDGIPDKLDKCPNKPETINGVKDDDGCPDPGKAAVAIVKGRLKIDEKVYFNSGSDLLKPRSFGILRQVASLIKASPQIHKILIEGHTDSRGDKEMNVDLSERRARRVMGFLIKEGVSWKKLKAKGYGPKFPIAKNSTGRGRALNRRVAFKVLGVVVKKGAK